VRKLYARRTEEIRASHILISLAPERRQKIPPRHTEKPPTSSGAESRGRLRRPGRRIFAGSIGEAEPRDLYYFTGGQMVPAFEDAAFAMKVGRSLRCLCGLSTDSTFSRSRPEAGARRGPGEPYHGPVLSGRIRLLKTRWRRSRRSRPSRDSIAMGVDFAELPCGIRATPAPHSAVGIWAGSPGAGGSSRSTR